MILSFELQRDSLADTSYEEFFLVNDSVFHVISITSFPWQACLHLFHRRALFYYHGIWNSQILAISFLLIQASCN